MVLQLHADLICRFVVIKTVPEIIVQLPLPAGQLLLLHHHPAAAHQVVVALVLQARLALRAGLQ